MRQSGSYPVEVVNQPGRAAEDEWSSERVRAPYMNAQFFVCSCGSDRFFCFSKPGQYETWIQCVNCALAALVHSG